jgi:hypothetical protein
MVKKNHSSLHSLFHLLLWSDLRAWPRSMTPFSHA